MSYNLTIMPIGFIDRLKSNNPQGYGIVAAKEVAGHKTVAEVEDLYSIADPILSLSGNNTNNDAIGQQWYVSDEGKFYQLIDWDNRHNATGWIPIGSISNSLAGKINLSSLSEIKTAQASLTQTNQIAYYLITDSNGSIPSTQSCYDIPSANVKQLSLVSPSSATNLVLSIATASVSLNPVGVNVGDLIAITRVKVAVSDLTAALGISLSLSGEIELYQYKLMSTNDVKAPGTGNSTVGVMGLASPWDKQQINKISGIESTANNALPKSSQLPSRWNDNMNNALQTGVYPWCTLGRPAGSTGAYTCIVRRTSTDDGAYNTIEQTAYGREGELGKVYKRIIFEKNDGSDTQYGEWLEVTNSGGTSDGVGFGIDELSIVLDSNGEFNTESNAIFNAENEFVSLHFRNFEVNSTDPGDEYYIVPKCCVYPPSSSSLAEVHISWSDAYNIYHAMFTDDGLASCDKYKLGTNTKIELGGQDIIQGWPQEISATLFPNNGVSVFEITFRDYSNRRHIGWGTEVFGEDNMLLIYIADRKITYRWTGTGKYALASNESVISDSSITAAKLAPDVTTMIDERIANAITTTLNTEV